MSDLTNTISSGLNYYFQGYAKRTRALAESLTEEQFRARPYSYRNSFVHLVLHITGNLNYYIGTQIAGTGYVRNRELEFIEPNPPSKEIALQRLDEAVAMVIATISAQSESDWSLPYSAVGADDVHDRFNAVLRCSIHFFHHIGQMIYLVKDAEVRGQKSAVRSQKSEVRS